MTGTPDLSALVHSVQSAQHPIAFAHIPHPRWPSARAADNRGCIPSHLRISILDSSFNPPTAAHLAMFRAPRPLHQQEKQESSEARGSESSDSYNARILLLSVRNVDKSLKDGDATYPQRLEMMSLLPQEKEGNEDINAAVALLDEPTFVAKARVIRAAVDRRMAVERHPAPRVRLTWMLGLDTLERLFAPRYYASEAAMHDALHEFFDPDQGDNEVVCAWRGTSIDEGAVPPEANPYLENGRIRMLDLGKELREISSSEIRARRAKGDESWRELLPARVADYVEKAGLYQPHES
jgi:nicotinamide-nucleotide adenylyltransferase